MNMTNQIAMLRERDHFLQQFMDLEYAKFTDSRLHCFELTNSILLKLSNQNKETFENLDNLQPRIEEFDTPDEEITQNPRKIQRLNGYCPAEWIQFLQFTKSLLVANDAHCLDLQPLQKFPHSFLSIFANFEKKELKLKIMKTTTPNDEENGLANKTTRCVQLLQSAKETFFKTFLLKTEMKNQYLSFFEYRKSVVLQVAGLWDDCLQAIDSSLRICPKNLFAHERRVAVVMHLAHELGFALIPLQTRSSEQYVKEMEESIRFGLKNCKNESLKLSFILNHAKHSFGLGEVNESYSILKKHQKIGKKNLVFCVIFASLLIDREEYKLAEKYVLTGRKIEKLNPNSEMKSTLETLQLQIQGACCLEKKGPGSEDSVKSGIVA